MTVSYSFDVAKARFCGLAQLLVRWKGSIYKIIWREFLVFCCAYTVLSVTYRCCLDEVQKISFEKIVLFIESGIDFIPLSFVLGFYVSLVIGRWWNQYSTIPWPDRVVFSIASYVDGSDERSRMIRRTLARYILLAKVLTFQAVSTSVKRRFPTTQHLVAAGIMTPAEKSVYEKLYFPCGKWWLPLHWFTALATRARKEGRIKDSILLDGLLKEVYEFRTSCAIMFGYDWISVPLVYTQVVTIATYLYSIALVVGRQYLDPHKGYPNHDIDLYIPFFTILQFFFYMGWLKVAEQILNPYGEDDDDFELNWCLDRSVHLSYLAVDHLRLKHPKVEKDYFWDDVEPVLPQTKESAFYSHPQLGSAFYLNIEEADYVPMDSLLETDEEDNIYTSDSVKRARESIRPSLLRRILSSGFHQSQKKKSFRGTFKKRLSTQGLGLRNRAYDETSESNASTNHITVAKTTSLNNEMKTSPSPIITSSASFRHNSFTEHKRNVRDAEEVGKEDLRSVKNKEKERVLNTAELVTRSLSAPGATNIPMTQESESNIENSDNCLESDTDFDNAMASIPEENSRGSSLGCIDAPGNSLQQLDAVHSLVEGANRMLLNIKRTMSIEVQDDDTEKLCSDSMYSLENNDGDNDERITDLKSVNNEMLTSETTITIDIEKQESNYVNSKQK